VTGPNGVPGYATRVSAGQVDAWLAELNVSAVERAERDGVTSWDVVLDGRLRPDIPVTLILDPALALLCWVHYAPPINESFRVSYRMLLRWNDELPFVKFGVSEDERPVLTLEIAARSLDRDALGLALARLVAVCDLLLLESKRWLEPPGRRKGAWPPAPPTKPTQLLERYADRLGELATTGVVPADHTPDPTDTADTLGRP
jgi:Putative bacterial sensory transduction regulator